MAVQIPLLDGLPTPETLFPGLARTPALENLAWFSLAIGGVFLIWGHTSRVSGKRGEELVREQIRSFALLFFSLTSAFWLGLLANAADAVTRESGLATPMGVATRMAETAMAMPEVTELFDLAHAAEMRDAQIEAERNGESAEKQAALMRASQQGWLSLTWEAMKQTVSDYADTGASLLGAIVRLPLTILGGIAAIVKMIFAVLGIALMIPFLLLAALISWAIVQFRYFLLVTGATMLPLFISAWGLENGHFFMSAGRNYVLKLASIALWPLSWMIGHTATVGLFNAWISLLSGTGLLAIPVRDALTIQEAVNSQTVAQALETTVTTGAKYAILANPGTIPFLWVMAAVVGALGLVCWIFFVTIMGPVWLGRLLSEGAHFFQEAAKQTAQQSLQIGGSVARVAAAAGTSGASEGMGAMLSGIGKGDAQQGGAILSGVGGFMGGAASSPADAAGGLASSVVTSFDAYSQSIQQSAAASKSDSQSEAMTSIAGSMAKVAAAVGSAGAPPSSAGQN